MPTSWSSCSNYRHLRIYIYLRKNIPKKDPAERCQSDSCQIAYKRGRLSSALIDFGLIEHNEIMVLVGY